MYVNNIYIFFPSSTGSMFINLKYISIYSNQYGLPIICCSWICKHRPWNKRCYSWASLKQRTFSTSHWGVISPASLLASILWKSHLYYIIYIFCDMTKARIKDQHGLINWLTSDENKKKVSFQSPLFFSESTISPIASSMAVTIAVLKWKQYEIKCHINLIVNMQ